jgi:hypothetical protein
MHVTCGAWFAGRDEMRELVPALQALVRQRMSGTSQAETVAVDVALDALIQMKARVPVQFLEQVYRSRPAQTLILAALVDRSADRFLVDIVTSGDEGTRWFTAANLVFARRSPELGPALLSSLRVRLTIDVDDREPSGSGGGSGFGPGHGCGAAGRAPGMPPWTRYTLTREPGRDMTTLAIGPVPVYFSRVVAPAGQVPYNSLTVLVPPSADERLRYIASLAGVPQEQSLRTDERQSIVASTTNRLAADVLRIRADVAARYRRFVYALVSSDPTPAGVTR